MHTVDIANKLLMQLPWKNEAVFTRLCYFGENFQWKLITVKGKSGLMEVFDWVWVFCCTSKCTGSANYLCQKFGFE